MRMAINIVEFIDCYLTIYIENDKWLIMYFF